MQYEEVAFQSFRRDEENGPELMANFVAEIAVETRIVDGMTSHSKLLITGRYPKARENPADEPEAIEFPPVEIDAEEFAGLNWVMPNWGVRAIIRPGSGIKEDLRTYIQVRSKPEIKTIYRHTGWTKINGKDAYLHSGGAITSNGNNPSVTVRLPNELQKYDLSTNVPPKEGMLASLELLSVADKKVTWPLFAATFCPIFGPCDFAIHISGRTGTYKSELSSLYQSHYGAGMDARHLPGSWSSTANALEAQSFLACNAVFTIDDFIPGGSSWQVRAYQQNADKIIRAQGNQAGRARLTDISSLQQTMYPRGIILSTGEDIPEGHSVRARMLIMELTPGDVKLDELTKAQEKRGKYVGATAGLIQYLCDKKIDLTPRVNQLRDAYRNIGHSRTPAMLAKLVTVAEAVLEYAVNIKAIKPVDLKSMKADARNAIETQGLVQHTFLEDSDPTDLFCAAIRQIFASGLGHVRGLNGGVPNNAPLVGWIKESGEGELPTFKAKGPCIGWISTPKNELYIDLTAGVSLIKKVAGPEMTLTKQTLFKRLKDAGKIIRVDDSRQRNTIRVTADGHVRNVLCMALSDTLDNQEAARDEE